MLGQELRVGEGRDTPTEEYHTIVVVHEFIHVIKMHRTTHTHSQHIYNGWE